MPTDYAPRNKPMHTREVRYERNDRFLGKRDWQRVAVFERAPTLSSCNGGSYDPPSKRRPSGRHGFSGENGRYNREHNSRISEHQPVFAAGYSGFGHKNDRYGVPGGMNHYPSSTAGRNGLRDGDDDYFRERDSERLMPSPNQAQPMHPYNSVFDSSLHPEGHRGSRYGWTDREHRERLSSSPDILDRKIGIRYGWGLQEKEIEGRQDRYGASREPSFGDLKSREIPDEFCDPFVPVSRFQQSQRVSTSLHDDKASSPRKKTRLGWGEGLARYEQKNTTKVRLNEDEQLTSARNGSAERESPVCEAGGSRCLGDADGRLPSSEKELTPCREPTPTADPVAEPVSESLPVTEAAATPVTSPALACSPELHDVGAPEELCKSPAATAVEEATKTEETVQNQDVQDVVNDAVPMSKEVVLAQVEQVEFEIDSIEKELARLAVEEAAAAQATEPGIVHSDSEMKDCGEAVKEEKGDCHATERCDSDDIMVEAQEASCSQPPSEYLDKCCEDFGHLLPKDYMYGKKLYNCPQEAAAWAQNEDLHKINKYRILERMLKKKQILKFKEQTLVLKYRLLKEVAKNDDVCTVDRTKGTRKADTGECRNGLNHRLSQKLRYSDGELALDDSRLMKKLLLEPLRQFRDSQRMPSMVLGETERTVQQIITSNRLVEDPIKYEQERKSINPWTAEEKKLFLEKFAVFNKNFGKIASFLQHKTVGDCVEFYYRNQKSEEFEKLRKKQQLKKRHSRASYLATTTSSGGRFRDSNAVSIQRVHTTVASSASYVGRDSGRPSRNHFKIVDRERLSLASDCVTADAGGKHTCAKETRSANISASVMTGVCSLSSDAPLTPSRISYEKAFTKEEYSTKQKGVRSSRGRREQVAEEVESEWTDAEKELFLDAVLLFGKDFRSIALHVRTRNEGQCKTFFSKARKRLKLDRIVEQHQLAQVTTIGDVIPSNSVAVVNRACDDPLEVKGAQNRLVSVVDKSFETEEMDVSVVVDSAGPKEGQEVADAEGAMEGTSAAPATLVDSPVSSVITSPGLLSSSSPAVQASVMRPTTTGSDLIESSAGIPDLKQFTEAEVEKLMSKELKDLQQKPGRDWSLSSASNIPLTENAKAIPPEVNGLAASRHRKRKADDVEGDCQTTSFYVDDAASKKNGFCLGGAVPAPALSSTVSASPPEKLNTSQELSSGLLSVLYPGVQVQNNAFQKQQATGQQTFTLQTAQLPIPPVVLNEQQQMLIHKQMARFHGQQHVPQFQHEEQLYQQAVAHQLTARQQQQHSYLPQTHFQQTAVKQESHFTSNQKLSSVSALPQTFLQQDQSQKENVLQSSSQTLHDPHQIAQQQQQHLLNLLVQQQQLAFQLHQPQQSGTFPQQQKKVHSLASTGEENGTAAKFLNLTTEFSDPLNFLETRPAAKPKSTEEQLSRGSDVKLFGQSLLSQPTVTKSTSEPSLTKSETTKAVPFLLGESWCSGSAEAQDREFAARCRNVNNGIYHNRLDQNGTFSLTAGLPDSDWQLHGTTARTSNGNCSNNSIINNGSSCTREALNLWKAAAAAAANGATTVGYCQQQPQHQTQHQQHQQQQQLQGLKDGMLFGSQFIQFANGSGWPSSSHAQQARILAQLSSAAEQQQQHQLQLQRQGLNASTTAAELK